MCITYPPAKRPVVFGDLREEGAKFVGWVPHNAKSQFVRSVIAQLAIEWAPAGDRYPLVVLEWEDPTKWTKDLRSLGYEYEKLPADDRLRRAAEATIRNPLSTTTINISFAIRRAIRRYLDIEQIEINAQTEKLRLTLAKPVDERAGDGGISNDLQNDAGALAR